MSVTFLAPAAATAAPAPVAPAEAALPAEAVLLTEAPALEAQPGTSALGGAFRAAGVAALAAGALASRGAQRRARTQRRAAAVVESVEEGEAPAEPKVFQPSEQLGAGEPLRYFDPLGFAKVGDEYEWRRLRASELKHGRVAMMASIGLVGQHFVRFPSFEKIPAGFAAFGKAEGFLGFFALLLACGPLELLWREEDGKEPGNFGDPFGVDMYTEEMRMKELNNGRMAMISVLAIWAAELNTGKDAMQQFGF